MYYHNGEGMITVYRGSPYQRGHGIGSFLKGLFRASLPLLKRGAQAVGKELLHSGVNFMEDLDHDVPAREAFGNRMKEARGNLKRKALNSLLNGQGYKRKRRRISAQSKRGRRKSKTSKKLKRKVRRKKARKPKRKSHKARRRRGSKKRGDIFD